MTGIWVFLICLIQQAAAQVTQTACDVRIKVINGVFQPRAVNVTLNQKVCWFGLTGHNVAQSVPANATRRILLWGSRRCGPVQLHVYPDRNLHVLL